MKILNINCIYYKRGVCDLPEVQKLLKLFRPTCLKLDDNECIFVKQHPKPPAPPAPPPKRLTEGSVRAGMRPTKWTDTRPIAPPPSPKSAKDRVLEKVEKKEFTIRCVGLDICPTCGYMLHTVDDDDSKTCNRCGVIFKHKGG